MTIQQVLARYESGAITAHEMVVDCLGRVDPGDPAAILDQIPPRALPQLAEFLAAYKPGAMLTLHDRMIPSSAQVLAARRWLGPASEQVLAPVAGDRRKGG